MGGSKFTPSFVGAFIHRRPGRSAIYPMGICLKGGKKTAGGSIMRRPKPAKSMSSSSIQKNLNNYFRNMGQ